MNKDGHSVESELRQATVLFADISGFTAMSEKMHPEEVTNIMNQCFHMMGECIDRHGGKIDKFIGDCVMVVFGVPDTLEKAPQKAVNAALDIRKGIYNFNKEKSLAIPLDVHIGINSGLVLSGMVGADQKKEFTVMGDTVNLASRLEDASDKGQILVGPITYRATKQDFEYRTLPPISLKGKAEPVPVYEALSLKRDNADFDTGDLNKLKIERSISSELVGRKNEMNKLRLMLHKVINGEGSIATITAEAGIGKSRIMAEIVSDPVMKQIILLEGKAISIGQNLSYHPIIDLLKKWAGIRDDDNENESLRKFEKTVRSIHPEEADEIIPFVGNMMRMKLPERYNARLKGIEGEAMEKITFKNIREIFIRISELHPLMIYIEDLHWADASTVELVISLLSLIEKHRILFIAVFRPGYEATGERLIKELNQNFNLFHTGIKLEPLDGSESILMIDNLLNVRGFPRALREQISSRTGGNPFFIEEVIRSFIDQGAVILKNGKFEVTDKIDKVEVPLTINEVIMSRIDRLDKETKDIIKTASVIGRNFFQKIIMAVAQDISDIDNRISYLENIQFIREHRRMDELEYLFKHALAQEAAYNSLLIQKRKEIHLQVAQAIEDIFHERLYEFYGMLAYHYNMGDDADKTEEYLIKAGEEALNASASNEAIYYYKEALKLYQNKYGSMVDPEKIAMMQKNIGIALFNKGHYSECIEYMDRALAFYGESTPKHPVTIALKAFKDFLIFIFGIYFPFFMWRKEPTQYDREILNLTYKKSQVFAVTDPIKFFIQSMYLVRRLANLDLTKLENEIGAGALPASSVIFSWSGVSLPLSRKILDFVKEKIDMSNPRSVLVYKVGMLINDSMSGDRTNEIGYDNDLINSNINFGDFYMVVSFIFWCNAISIGRGDFTKMALIENKLHSLYSEYENVFTKVNKFNICAYFLLKTRKLLEGIKEADEGIQFDGDKNEFSLWYIYLHTLKSRMLLYIGNFDEAVASMRIAEDMKSGAKTATITFGEYLLGQFQLNLYLFEDALKRVDKTSVRHLRNNTISYGRKVLRVSDKFSLIKTETLKFMGVYFWLICKPAISIKWWQKAIEAGEKFDDRLELSRVYFEIGKRLLENPVTPGHTPMVKKASAILKKKTGLTPGECLNKAESMFKEMDLQWDLEQIQRIQKN
jgi:class 3 adenylate cyclase/tetratricopeptide (TPR) repeat protein